QRDDIFFTFQESEKSIRQKIANNPHSKFLVCDNDLDSIVGYIASKDILPALIHENNIDLAENIRKHYCKSLLIIPNTLTLSEALDKFNETNEDFAIILNEYALVVGLITLEDVMTTLMGDVVSPFQEELIIKRAEDSWLIDGTTPIEDVVRVLEIDSFPEQDSYETLAGFIMYVLKSIPKKAEKVEYDNYIFEIMDVDNYKIDQVLVTKKKDNNS
ncbi:MAG: HlyC/CorC family transporter, partial [Spirochaetaceae bacterium]|nr:HlyC/CorC family transporter [Spirochaetaceae bacterium]